MDANTRSKQCVNTWPLRVRDEDLAGAAACIDRSLPLLPRAANRIAATDRADLSQSMERTEEEGDDETMLLWEELPRDLVTTVFSWLPIAAILRSRTVSKHFHAWLTSLSFLDEIARLPTRSSWLVLFPASTPSTACAYDPSVGSWIALPIPLQIQIQPLASSRGLICAAPRPDLYTDHSSSREFFVGNLVTRSWVAVSHPRELSQFFFLVAGIKSTGRSGFTIVVAGTELVSHDSGTFRLSTWVFESATSSWSKGSTVLIAAAISTSKAMSGSKFFVVSGTRELLSYDLESGSWSRIDLPARGLSSVKLIDRCGRLVMVARTKDGLSVWEMDHESDPRQWKHVERMPRCLSDDLLQSRSFACVGSGDVAYFASAKCASILSYTFPTKSWRWIRCCPEVTKNSHYDVVRGICLEARLEINPAM